MRRTTTATPEPEPTPEPAPERTTHAFDVRGLLADGVVTVTGMPDYQPRSFTVADGVAVVPVDAVQAFTVAFPAAQRLT